MATMDKVWLGLVMLIVGLGGGLASMRRRRQKGGFSPGSLEAILFAGDLLIAGLGVVLLIEAAV